MHLRNITLWLAEWAGYALLICLFSVAALAAECSFQRSLQVSGPVNLDVTTGSGSIDLRSGAASSVQVCGYVKVSNWFTENPDEILRRIIANPPIQQSGNDIRIGHIDDPDLRHHVSISYQLIVPADTSLRSQTGSGDQQIEGIHGPAEVQSGSGSLSASDVGGTLRAQTGSGNITLEHIKGNVRAKTGSGSIRASDVAGGFEGDTGSGHISLEQSAPGAVRAQTGSGGLELRGVHGSLEAHTGSGNIEADGAPTGGWTLQTGSGGVRLRFKGDAAFDLDAHTSSGSISVNQPLTVQGTLGRKDIRGKVRGGGVPVDVQTGSGNIEIE